jgi:hypothetical protein
MLQAIRVYSQIHEREKQNYSICKGRLKWQSMRILMKKKTL